MGARCWQRARQAAVLCFELLLGFCVFDSLACLPDCDGKSGGAYALCSNTGATFACQSILDCVNWSRDLEGKGPLKVAYKGACLRDEGETLEQGDVCFTTFDETVQRKVDFSGNCGEGLFCEDVTSPLNFSYGNVSAGLAPESNYSKSCVPPIGVEWCPDSPGPRDTCDYDAACADSLVDKTGRKVGLQCFRFGQCAMRSDLCCSYECISTGETTMTTTPTTTPASDCEGCTTATSTPTSTPVADEIPEEAKSRGKGGVAAAVTIVVILLVVAAGALYYKRTSNANAHDTSPLYGDTAGLASEI